jgi:AcrR family transcriptional regulator
MPTTHDPIQELLITARRNQILDAATQVFAEKGFHRATIKDIARVAGIADGTVYNYFENKTALMLGIFDRLNESDQRDEDFSKFTEVDFRSFMKAYQYQPGDAGCISHGTWPDRGIHYG